MTNRFLISVAAAALIAGTGFANAQGMGHEGSAGAPAEHAAPAEHGAPGGGAAMRPSEKMQSPGGASQHAQEKMQAPGAGQHAQEGTTAAPKGERSAQENSRENNLKGEPSKGMNAQTEEKGAPGKDMKAEGRDNRAADSKTVGQAGAGGKLSTEQRTKISSVIRDQHVESITNVNFAISVGTRVPRDVSFHPLPAEVVTYYPEWRGYEFILVRGQIVVVDPGTYEIVAVIDA